MPILKPELYLIALGTLASEDLACVAAGLLVAKGNLDFATAVAACAAGIMSGDLALFLAGRLAGWNFLKWPLVAGYLPEERVRKGLEWINRRGLPVVLISRFTPGLRLPVYFAAGLLGAPIISFAAYFLIAAVLWTPLLVGLSWLLGEGVLRSALHYSGSAGIAIVACAAVTLAFRQALKERRRIWRIGARLARWEFLPPWFAYLPLIPYFLFLAAKHRSLTVFTAANPGIPTGGLLGESKSAILDSLRLAGDCIAPYRLIPGGLNPEEKLKAVRDFRDTFPIVLKPDTGERGAGVLIARSETERDRYVRATTRDFLVQEYVGGLEFGIFYSRYPGGACGRITSLTAKRFPIVTGDGTQSLGDLIRADSRAGLIFETYERSCRLPLHHIPAPAEQVQLVEIGSHCRGAIFLNAAQLITPELERAVDRVAKTSCGFYFGRFDVRAESVEALQRGEFRVLELNGVGAESTHIYDPAVDVVTAYRVMFEQWRSAFEIGSINRRLGAKAETFVSLIRAVLVHRKVNSVRTGPQ